MIGNHNPGQNGNGNGREGDGGEGIEGLSHGQLRDRVGKTGHWNQKENAKYYAFLDKFKDRFIQKESRREWKIFKALSEFMRTRNANQCRSHHHKMNKNYKSIDETMASLRKKNPFLEERAKKYSDQLAKLKLDNIELEKFHGLFRLNSPRKVVGSQTHPLSRPAYNQHFLAQPPKAQDITNIPTQATYFQQAQPKPLPYPYFQPSSPQAFFPAPRGYSSYNTLYGEHQRRERDLRWLECHRVFVRWVEKVTSLLG